MRLREKQQTSLTLGKILKLKQKNLRKRLCELLKKDIKTLTEDEKCILSDNKELVGDISRNVERRSRLQEFEEDFETVNRKCAQLAEMISRSQHVVVYTGAGISTSADIPDYRGSDGVWNRIHSGKDVIMKKSLMEATPTTTHMCLKKMYDSGIVKHIVSQNCDGLHLRSGVPQHALSEVHGNMYMELCKDCDIQYYRIFDVTAKTSLHRHKTERRCDKCGNSLSDSIVHFGERSNLRWPHNWTGAVGNAQKADLILCLGSSLRVLRSYRQLWLMNRPKMKRPELVIVNLQWTAKDAQARMKIHSRVDVVMEMVARQLGITIPTYHQKEDPLYSLASPCDYSGETLPLEQMHQKNCTEIDRIEEAASTSTVKIELSKPTSDNIAISVHSGFILKDVALDSSEEITVDPRLTSLNGKAEAGACLTSDAAFGTECSLGYQGPAPHANIRTIYERNESRVPTIPAWFGKGVKSKFVRKSRKRKR